MAKTRFSMVMPEDGSEAALLRQPVPQAIESHLRLHEMRPDEFRTVAGHITWIFVADTDLSIVIRFYRHEDEHCYCFVEICFGLVNGDASLITDYMARTNGSTPYPVRLAISEGAANSGFVAQAWFRADQINPSAIGFLIDFAIAHANRAKEAIKNFPGYLPLMISASTRKLH